MKRIYSYMFAAVAMFAAVSCQKENDFDTPEVNDEAFAITAVANADTKTVLNGLKTYWTPTDALTAFDATGANRKFTTDITENSASAKFTTPTFVLPENIEAGKLLAIYPYTEGATTDFQTKVSGLEIPATQQAVAGSFDPDAAVSYVLDGVANQYSLKFNNVYGLFEFTIKNDGVKKVSVKANGGEKIAGPVDLYLNGTLAAATGAVSEVTLEGDFVNGSTYYVALIPGTYAGGITVSFDGESVKSTTNSITLEKNQIRGMGELFQPQASEWALVGAFSGWADKSFNTTIKPDVVVLENVAMKAAEGFLVRKPATDWADKYGVGNVNYLKKNNYIITQQGGADMCLEEDGTYDIYFNTSTKAIYIMADGTSYTVATKQTANGKEPVQEEPEVTENKLYLKPNNNWKTDNARFAAYFFGGTPAEIWVSMTDSDKDGIYEVNIPEGYNYGCSVIFCRMNPSTTANNWSNKWNQTKDLKTPTNGNNLYTVKEGAWTEGDGSWSKK